MALELYGHVRRLLPEHRAEEVKTLGDGVVLRGEDPGAAILLGLRIVEELERRPGFPAVRVGIHTGPAVFREGDWYGRTVNVAARLCSAAGGAEVLVSESAREAARALPKVGFGERRWHWLRNVTEPVAAWTASARPCWRGWLRHGAGAPSFVEKVA